MSVVHTSMHNGGKRDRRGSAGAFRVNALRQVWTYAGHPQHSRPVDGFGPNRGHMGPAESCGTAQKSEPPKSEEGRISQQVNLNRDAIPCMLMHTVERVCQYSRGTSAPALDPSGSGKRRNRDQSRSSIPATSPVESRPIRSTSRSRSSIVENSRVILPLRLPTSILTGASRRLESLLVMSTT